jgi:hypothetical protein
MPSKSPTHELIELIEDQLVTEQDGECDEYGLSGIVFVGANKENQAVATTNDQSLPE